MSALLLALRERDSYTYGHSVRVARDASLLARAAGLNEFQQRTIEIASIFHDIGKMGIPDGVLLKPGPLTQREEAIMREHPVKSVEILAPLSNIPLFKSTFPGVRHHHERIDGQGYPDGIKGDDVPLEARIILIADTYDAMTTSRPYRRAMSGETAYKELNLFAGRQFDRHLVEIFLKAHPKWKAAETDAAASTFVEKTLFPYRKAA